MASAKFQTNKGLFITFEGTEGSGKSTQIVRLESRLRNLGHAVRVLREPGGTLLGEEIRHTLKHSPANRGMTPEAELLLLNASRAQLVREIILPALQAREIVLCDRFFDSTIAYQGYGRELSLQAVRSVIALAIGGILPDLTLLLQVSVSVSESRRAARGITEPPLRDHFEASDRAFFERVEQGFQAIATAEPDRVHVVDGGADADQVEREIWAVVSNRFNKVSTSD